MKLTAVVEVIAFVGCAAACAVACGDGNTSEPGPAPSPSATEMSPPPGGATPAPAPATTAPAATTPPAATCAGKQALSGNLDWTITSGGRMRTVHVHVPTGYDAAKATPVVLDFHGLSMNASGEDALSAMKAKADKAGFIAVQGEGIGTGTQQSWNAGVCCGDAASMNVDDVAFVGQTLDELEAKLCVDEKRIFSTGMSNGGALSYRLACELSGRIAAIAPVSHVLTVPAATCKPTRPVSVFAFNGTADPLVPYAGNGSGYPGVVETLDGWAARNGCSPTSHQISMKGDVTCVTYDGCKAGAEVSHCTVDGGGHQWPGGATIPLLGKNTQNISATDTMWDFFVRHPKLD